MGGVLEHARQWARKAVVRAASSPLIHLVHDDETALNIIRASYAVNMAELKIMSGPVDDRLRNETEYDDTF